MEQCQAGAWRSQGGGMTAPFTESVVEQAALACLESTGWQVRNGADIAPGEPAAERDDYGQVVLAQRLRDALGRLNLLGQIPRSLLRLFPGCDSRSYERLST